MAIHILGIRHHGPGSAKNVLAFLEEHQPDIILIEGPPEADVLLPFLRNNQVEPPVAILAYQTDNIQQAVYYPFAIFSPEWQAMQYASKANIHARFIDLPLTHWLALSSQNESENSDTNSQQEQTSIHHSSFTSLQKNSTHHLATIAGFTNEETWWEQMFEQRQNNTQIFEAVSEAMHALRENYAHNSDKEEQLREAWMRKMIRLAEKEMFQNIVVICGAWHVPALTKMPLAKDDNALLKSLPKVKIEATWIPWTYDRLSMYSGYGAGIQSPGWYHHKWLHPTDDGTLWMTKVAKLFRDKQIDVSVAHVIESVRLANALSALRNISSVGLDELNEATLSVVCNGEAILLDLIQKELIVSNAIGSVANSVPKPPLQVDIEKLQKRLRLPINPDAKEYLLDLRKENDLERSIFLHRLHLLEIFWGQKKYSSGKGTFKESWQLQWQPSFVIQIIEKGVWGNTVEEASNAWLMHQCNTFTQLSDITALLENVIPANLSTAATAIANRIVTVAAANNDVLQLVSVLPSLVGIMRYGNVRKTDAEMVRAIAESMITRVCIGLPTACCGINEETALQLTDNCVSINHSIHMLQDSNYMQEWTICLQQIAFQNNAAAIIRGFAARQLMDAKQLEETALQNLFYSSLSYALPIADAAAWLEGFLKGSGTLLLLNHQLWQIVNSWVEHLNEESFIQALPLLRRTFSHFSSAERRKLGEKVKNYGNINTVNNLSNYAFNQPQAQKSIPVIMELLGYSTNKQV